MHVQIPGCQNAYCKYEVVAGEDWQILDGMDNGITQVARQSSGQQSQHQPGAAGGPACRACCVALRSAMQL